LKSRLHPGHSVCEYNIISNLNNLLDRKLVESAINARIAGLAGSINDYRETIRSILKVLNEIAGYEIAGTLVANHRDPCIVISMNGEYKDDEISEFKLRMLRDAANYIGKSIIEDNLEINMTCEPYKDPVSSIDFSNFYSAPLRSRGMVIGTISVITRAGEYSSGGIAAFWTIASQAGPLIDSARLYAEVERLSITDGLTGLYNRRYLEELLKREFNRVQRHSIRLSVLMVDVDNFKSVNDNYGHHQGDIVLRELGEVLRRQTREIDVVARYGGEEFVILLPETDIEGAVLAAERVHQSVSSHKFASEGGHIGLTVSVGAVSCPDRQVNDHKDLMRCVDNALYCAKHRGKNCVFPALALGRSDGGVPGIYQVTPAPSRPSQGGESG
jgi:diguanylate cyclase (GGDEF)-like protein